MEYRLKEVSAPALHPKNMDLPPPAILHSHQTHSPRNMESLHQGQQIPIALPHPEASLDLSLAALPVPSSPITKPVLHSVHVPHLPILPLVQGIPVLILKTLRLYLNHTVHPHRVICLTPMECRMRGVWPRNTAYLQAALPIRRLVLSPRLILLLQPGVLKLYL